MVLEIKLKLEKDREKLQQDKENLIQGVKDWTKENSEIIIQFLNQSNELEIRKQIIEEQIETRNALRAPEVWPWVLGFGFTTSALAAIISSVTEKYRETKKIYFYLPYGASLALMGIGFITLISIFYVIFSYVPYS